MRANLSPNISLAGVDHSANKAVLSVTLNNDCKIVVIKKSVAERGREPAEVCSESNMKGSVSYISCNKHELAEDDWS